MKVLLASLIAFCFLTCNHKAEKEPGQTTKEDSIKSEINIPEHRDSLKPVIIENGQTLFIDSALLTHLFLYYSYDNQGRMVPELKMYAIHNPYDYISYKKGYYQYFLRDNSAYSFSDTIILTGVADGEMGSSVLTVWKKEGEKFRYIAVSDHSLLTYAHVDSVFNLGRNKYLLVGMTEWGDQGDNAGSIWFAIWELPGSFKMIFFDKWSTAYNEDKYYSYNYTFKDNIISLEKLVVTYKNNEHCISKMHTDFKISKKLINIDLTKTDKIADFNSYEDVGEQM